MTPDHLRYKRSVSLAAVNDAMEHHCDGMATALIQVFSSASAVGVQLVAEGRTFDDAPWMTLHVMPTNDLTPATPINITAAFTGVPAFGWRVDLQGLSSYRVRVAALTSGALVVNSRLTQQDYT